MIRDKLMAILQSLDTDSLVNALSSQGIQVEHPALNKDSGSLVPEVEHVPTWNETKLQTSGAKRPPIHTPENYLDYKEQPREQRFEDNMGSDNQSWIVNQLANQGG